MKRIKELVKVEDRGDCEIGLPLLPTVALREVLRVCVSHCPTPKHLHED